MDVLPMLTIDWRERKIQRLDELAKQIEGISGYTLEQLKDLFAAGYTLTPPVMQELSMEELAKILEEKE